MLKIDKDPDGGFVYDGAWYETVEDVLAIGILGFCGCGIPDEALALIVKCLKTRAFPNEPKYTILDIGQIAAHTMNEPETAAYVIAYLLSDKGLTEHGSSVPGWLTPQGEDFVRRYEESQSHTVS